MLQDLNNLSTNSPKSKGGLVSATLNDLLFLASRNHSKVNMAMSAIIPTSLNPQVTEDVSDTNLTSMDFIDFNAGSFFFLQMKDVAIV